MKISDVYTNFELTVTKNTGDLLESRIIEPNILAHASVLVLISRLANGAIYKAYLVKTNGSLYAGEDGIPAGTYQLNTILYLA